MPYKDLHSPQAVASLRAARRKHYHANKAVYMARAKAKKQEMRAYVRDLKANPCADCEQAYPYYVMQFDHVGDDKVQDINKIVNRGSWTLLRNEIAKCELVCANCHAIRTFGRHSGTGSEPSV